MNRVTILERDTKEHLKLREAEVKFITRNELDLKLETINLSTSYTKDEVAKIEGKLDDILDYMRDKTA